MSDHRVLYVYLARYRNKASVLTIIHSDLANKNDKWDTRHTVTIVILTAIITFLGFIGSERLLSIFWTLFGAIHVHSDHQTLAVAADQAASAANHTKEATAPQNVIFDFFFNLAVLLLFIASLLNLIFRWKERFNSHFQGVVKLKGYIGWLDEIMLLGLSARDSETIRCVRSRYQSIVEVLPPNSDKDYEEAKRKQSSGSSRSSPPQSMHAIGTASNQDQLLAFVETSPTIMSVLNSISRISDDLWLGGGSVRNVVWDILSNRQSQGHDFDVIYFDALDDSERREKEIEEVLRKRLPRVYKLSVKNQARMHLVNGEKPVHSLKEAIENWPERATAIAIRLDAMNNLQIIAPYGCDDVLDMIIRPTPNHEINRESFNRRLTTKDWQATWPQVRIIDSTHSNPDSPKSGKDSSGSSILRVLRTLQTKIGAGLESLRAKLRRSS